MFGGAALAVTLARDGAMWRMPVRVPDRETILGTDHRSTSDRMCGIDPWRYLDRVRYNLCRRCALSPCR